MQEIDDYIEIHPDFRSGKPCFKGTRITVYDVLEYLAGGMTEVELLADFPALSSSRHTRATTSSFESARRDGLTQYDDALSIGRRYLLRTRSATSAS